MEIEEAEFGRDQFFQEILPLPFAGDRFFGHAVPEEMANELVTVEAIVKFIESQTK